MFSRMSSARTSSFRSSPLDRRRFMGGAGLRYTEGFKTVAPIVLPGGAFLSSSGDYRFGPVAKSEALAELANTKPLELDRKAR
jgi:hypothetical protein